MMDKRQARVDPDLIDDAVRAIDGFTNRTRDFETRIGYELGRLRMTFQDDAYDEFADCFGQTRKLILDFADQTSVILPKMRDDADKIRAAEKLKPRP